MAVLGPPRTGDIVQFADAIDQRRAQIKQLSQEITAIDLEIKMFERYIRTLETIPEVDQMLQGWREADHT